MSEVVNIQRPDILSELSQQTLRRLMRAWFDFERRLSRVNIINRLDVGSFSIDDYRNLLLNLRPQVIEGGRWISRCASSFDREHADIRSVVIGHAKDEHRDYEVLEQDYVAAGGILSDIRERQRNPGTEALHAFLMYRASQPNPTDMLGAMWIIEGLGEKMANDWADRIDELTNGNGSYTKFMRYHGDNDGAHMDKLYGLVDHVCIDEKVADNIISTAHVVGRLYALQLEEIDYINE